MWTISVHSPPLLQLIIIYSYERSRSTGHCSSKMVTCIIYSCVDGQTVGRPISPMIMELISEWTHHGISPSWLHFTDIRSEMGQAQACPMLRCTHYTCVAYLRSMSHDLNMLTVIKRVLMIRFLELEVPLRTCRVYWAGLYASFNN